MRHLTPYPLFEKSLLEAEEDLTSFQRENSISTDVADTLASIDATEIALATLLPFTKESNDLSVLCKNAAFKTELKARGLKAGEVYSTQDDSTVVKLPLRYVMVYPKGSSNLDTPVYLLLQYLEKSWTPVRLYYVQKDIKHFYDNLSTVVMTITKKDNANKSWVYKSSNSGRNWSLENKSDATPSFPASLSWQEVQNLKNHSKIDVVFN